MTRFISILIRSNQAIRSRLRNYFYRILGLHFNGYALLKKISIPRQWNNIFIDSGVALDDGVTLICSDSSKSHKLSIGARTYINRYTILDASLELKIGEDCMIGPHCYITDHDHARKLGTPSGSLPLISKPTIIGDRVWLGAHSVVLKGVTIGNDVVIAAGAVVTKDVVTGAVVAGIPAKAIHKTQLKPSK